MTNSSQPESCTKFKTWVSTLGLNPDTLTFASPAQLARRAPSFTSRFPLPSKLPARTLFYSERLSDLPKVTQHESRTRGKARLFQTETSQLALLAATPSTTYPSLPEPRVSFSFFLSSQSGPSIFKSNHPLGSLESFSYSHFSCCITNRISCFFLMFIRLRPFSWCPENYLQRKHSAPLELLTLKPLSREPSFGDITRLAAADKPVWSRGA